MTTAVCWIPTNRNSTHIAVRFTPGRSHHWHIDVYIQTRRVYGWKNQALTHALFHTAVTNAVTNALTTNHSTLKPDYKRAFWTGLPQDHRPLRQKTLQFN